MSDTRIAEPTTNVCYTCGYWLQDKDEQTIGRCRRYPPPAVADAKCGQFPVTRTDDWCGEWAKPL